MNGKEEGRNRASTSRGEEVPTISRPPRPSPRIAHPHPPTALPPQDSPWYVVMLLGWAMVAHIVRADDVGADIRVEWAGWIGIGTDGLCATSALPTFP